MIGQLEPDRPQLAVDREIEEGEVSDPVLDLQPNAHRPDFLELERRFLPDQLAPVPGNPPLWVTASVGWSCIFCFLPVD